MSEATINVTAVPAVPVTSPVYDQDFINRLLAERDAAKQQLAEYQAKEKIAAENHALSERIRKEPRSISTRNTLVLRRTPSHDVIAPARDILAYLDLYDQKEDARTDTKKIRVSDIEINAYHDLKAQGASVVTIKMVKDIMDAKGKGNTPDTNDEETEQDTDQVLESETDQETEPEAVQ